MGHSSSRRRKGPPPSTKEVNEWGGLGVDLLLQVVAHLEDNDDRKAAHRVCRAWRAAVCLSTLRLEPRTLCTLAIKESFPNTTELVVRNAALAPLQMLQLGGLAQLRTLHVENCCLEHGGSVLALAALTQLVELKLRDVRGTTPEVLDDTLCTLTQLQRLTVETGPAARGPSLKHLGRLASVQALSISTSPGQLLNPLSLHLPQLRGLQALWIRANSNVTNGVVGALAGLTGLTLLHLPEAPLITDWGLASLAGLTRLEELDLSCSQIQADDAVSNAGVAHLSGLLSLRHLSLGGRSGVTGAGLHFLAAATQLSHLDLTAVRLGAVGGAAFLRHLRRLACLRAGRTGMLETQFVGVALMPGLAQLDVSYTGFSDRCCLYLSNLPGLTALRLDFCPISNEGLAHLHRYCTALRVLELSGCRVSALGVARALRAHPGIDLWGARRAHLPRACNVLHTFLFAAPARQLRVAWAPEAGRVQTWTVAAALGAACVLYAAFVLGVGLLIAALPIFGVLALTALLYAAATGSARLRLRVHRALASVEGFFAAALLGITGCPAPPAPAPLV